MQVQIVTREMMRIRTKADLNRLYDALYVCADAGIMKVDPCQLQVHGTEIEKKESEPQRTLDNTDYNKRKRRTITQAKTSCIGRMGEPRHGMCCGSCFHLTSKGCRVKCLNCRLYTCGGHHIEDRKISKKRGRVKNKKKKIEQLRKYFRSIRRIAEAYHLVPGYYISKTATMAYAWKRVKEGRAREGTTVWNPIGQTRYHEYVKRHKEMFTCKGKRKRQKIKKS